MDFQYLSIICSSHSNQLRHSCSNQELHNKARHADPQLCSDFSGLTIIPAFAKVVGSVTAGTGLNYKLNELLQIRAVCIKILAQSLGIQLNN